MAPRHRRLIAVTGGPGSGKTTLIDALRAVGFATTPEAGRALIQDQSAIAGPGLPWNDAALFTELMLSWELRSYRRALRRHGLVFFDHALPCIPGYLRLIGRPTPAHVDAAVRSFPYCRQVFVAPPWPEIYRNDAERRQTFDEARHTCEAMTEAYRHYGYELVELPRDSVSERLRFVRSHLDVAQ